MLQPIQVISMALAWLIVAGCGAPHPIKYYALQIPSAPAPSMYKYPIEVLVGRVVGPSILSSEPIVYKTGANELGTYRYHRWTDAPVEMVQEKLIRLLRRSGNYKSVAASARESNSDLILRGKLYEFAEVDADRIGGLVTMEFELYDRKNAKLLWSHFYSQTEPVEGKTVPGVVRAIDRNLDRGLNEVVEGMALYFAAHSRSTPPVSASQRGTAQ